MGNRLEIEHPVISGSTPEFQAARWNPATRVSDTPDLQAGAVKRCFISARARALADFLLRLRSATDQDIGHLVAFATDARHRLATQGYNLLESGMPAKSAKALLRQLRQVRRRFEKNNDWNLAAGITVWEHTFVAAKGSSLKSLGDHMWQELQRGFPHVDQAARDAHASSAIVLETTGANAVPTGFAFS